MLFAVERVGGAGGVVDAKCRYNRPPGAERGGQRRRERRVFLFTFFLSCHKAWILFHRNLREFLLN